MKNLSNKQRRTPQLTRFFEMVYSKNSGDDMWKLTEQLILKKVAPESAVQSLFSKEKPGDEIINFFQFLHDGREELGWLIKDVYIHDNEPIEAVKNAREYINEFRLNAG